MTNRQRRITLWAILGVWAVVVLSYAVQLKWPDPAWAGVPPAAITMLAPRGRSDPAVDREAE